MKTRTYEDCSDEELWWLESVDLVRRACNEFLKEELEEEAVFAMGNDDDLPLPPLNAKRAAPVPRDP